MESGLGWAPPQRKSGINMTYATGLFSEKLPYGFVLQKRCGKLKHANVFFFFEKHIQLEYLPAVYLCPFITENR